MLCAHRRGTDAGCAADTVFYGYLQSKKVVLALPRKEGSPTAFYCDFGEAWSVQLGFPEGPPPMPHPLPAPATQGTKWSTHRAVRQGVVPAAVLVVVLGVCLAASVPLEWLGQLIRTGAELADRRAQQLG